MIRDSNISNTISVVSRKKVAHMEPVSLVIPEAASEPLAPDLIRGAIRNPGDARRRLDSGSRLLCRLGRNDGGGRFIIYARLNGKTGMPN